MIQEQLLGLTSDIVSAHIGNNAVSVNDVPRLIEGVYGSLASLGKEPEPAAPELVREPGVSIRASIKADKLTCLECGTRHKTLKRHLAGQHGLTADGYRARWKLAADYPMISADYAAERAALAVRTGFGKKGGVRKKAVVPAEPAAAAATLADTTDKRAAEAPAGPTAKRPPAKSSGGNSGKTPSKRKTRAA